MRRQKSRPLPVSQRDLAAYLGISETLFSMTQTGRHGARKLSSALSTKLEELLVANQQSKLANVPVISFRKMRDRSPHDCARLANQLSRYIKNADARLAVLDRQLDKMKGKEQEDKYWLNTVDQLLAKLPKNKESAGKRIWLENQQVTVLERLKKNDLLAQAKLEIQIETEKVRARVYRNIQKMLLKD